MTMRPKRTKAAERLIARLQKQESAAKRRRCDEIVRAVKVVGMDFLDGELDTLATVAHGAYGRVMLRRRSNTPRTP